MMTNESLSHAVTQRAKESSDVLSKVIFDVIREEHLDWRHVDHEEVKELLVRAIRARRDSQREFAP